MSEGPVSELHSTNVGEAAALQPVAIDSPWFDRLTIWTCLALGAFFIWAANYYTVFDDEALSCRLYAMPMGEMLRALWHGEDPDPPLYYIVQNSWVHIFGVGRFALRALSIVFFLSGLVVLRRAAAAWYDPATGRAAMIVAAVHPAHLLFGMAGRWYSLMFLLVGLLLLHSSPAQSAVAAGRPGRRWPTWAVVAAAVCYTNYFGPVIVGLVWLAVLIRDRANRDCLKKHVWAGLAAAILYAPWVPVFWHHVCHFPQSGGELFDYASSAVRLVLVLLTGNLASPTAIWAWGPMVLGALVVAAVVVRDWRRHVFLGIVVLGAAAAGILSRTLIDKYAMIVSGPFCLLIAAALSRGTMRRSESQIAARSDRLPRIAAFALLTGWLGCALNLVIERHWSSLRWLDPFEFVTRELYDKNWHRSYPDAVCSHPSARYYFALHRAIDSNRSAIEKRIQPFDLLAPRPEGVESATTWRADPADWLDCWREQDQHEPDAAYFALTPGAMTRALSAGQRPELINTLETTGFSELPEWDALLAILNAYYEKSDEPITFLEDPSANLKNRLDPAFSHPAWRITVHRWRLKP